LHTADIPDDIRYAFCGRSTLGRELLRAHAQPADLLSSQ
jgi:hypothetical protein